MGCHVLSLSEIPDERPPPLERPLDNINLNINVLISTRREATPLKRPLLMQKGWPHNRGSTVCLKCTVLDEQCTGAEMENQPQHLD